MSEEKMFEATENENQEIDDDLDNEIPNGSDNEIDDLELLTDDDDDIDVELGDDIEDDQDDDGVDTEKGVSETISNVEYYDSDDEEEDDEEFDKLNNTNISVDLLNEHPEFVSHNIKEVNALSNVIRDANGIIIDELHRTIPFVTRYEKAKIIGERSKQLSYSNVEPMIKVPPDIIDSYDIAKMEYNANMIPFIIKRNLPDGSCEYWKFKDLEKILFD